MAKYSGNKIVIFNLAGKFILNGMNFFVTPIFSRILGTENYGLFAIYLTWQSVFQILIGLQMHSIIGTASLRFSRTERCRLFSCNTSFVSVVFLISLFLVIVLNKPLSAFIGLPLVLIILMVVHSYAGYGVNVVTGTWAFDREANKNFFTSLILSITNIFLSFLFIFSIKKNNLKYIGRIIGSALPTILFGIVCVIFLLYKGKTFYNRTYLKYTLAFTVPIVFHGLSNLLLNQSDRIMLQKMATIDTVGVYSMVYTLTNVLLILWEAFNTAWVPFFYEDLKEKKIDKIREKSHNYIWIYNYLVIGFLLVSPEVYVFYASKVFSSGVNVIPFLAVGTYFVYLYSFSINYKYYKGKTVSIAIGTILSGILNIGLNCIFIPKYGIFGAALATCISYGILWVFHQIGATLLDKDEYPYNFVFFMPGVVIVIVCAILSFGILINNPIARWGLAIIDGLALLISLYKRKSVW